jgi:hypothetical protein
MSVSGMNVTHEGVLRAVAFFDVLDYAPTVTEAHAWAEGESDRAIDPHVLEEGGGRLALPGRLQPLLALARERTPLFPRKLRRAQQVARWLVRNPNVRFVALANTTALAHARDGSDLDFFVIVRHGSIWSTRLMAGAPYRLTGHLAGDVNEPADAVCLSYFISDQGLDLAPHMLRDGADPYFRYWFLALLPLYDDGVGQALWDVNTAITRAHPHSESWMISPDIAVSRPALRLPGAQFFERPARAFQSRWFPPAIREHLNRDTSVLVSDHALKFHVGDRRAQFRAQYEERLRALNLI